MSNIFNKLNFYQEAQKQKLMLLLSQPKQADLWIYLGLMCQKTCLHLRIGQVEQVEHTLADLFNILHDKSRVGFPEVAEGHQRAFEEIPYKRPHSLFDFNDEDIIGFFLQ